ncbi:MAG TPA: glycosyltransferase, partial [Bryobacteraceae bacterium]|nr:glycosyltransferase [Bryobacteraceae bacterium]
MRRLDDRTEAPVETIAIPREAVDEPIEPRVSAILVGHNQAAALRRAIAALEKSKDRDKLEIIAIDCGSRDETAQLDLEFDKISLLRLPHDMGMTRALNIGTRTARAELLLFLSPNAEVAPDTVVKLADALEPDIETSAVAPLLVDDQGRAISKKRPLPDKASLSAACAGEEIGGAEIDQSQASIVVDYPNLDALLVRKHFIKGMNYFDERFGEYWADADLGAKIRRASRRALLIPSIRVVYRAAEDPRAGDTLAVADRKLGAAHFLGKYYGFLSGMSFRLGAIFSALGRFNFGELTALVGGQKIDGTQSM